FYLLNDIDRLIREAIDLLRGHVDALDMLRAKIINKRQYAEQEYHGHRRINPEACRPASQTGPDLIRLHRERSYNENSPNDHGDGLVDTPDGTDRIGDDGSGNNGEAE